MKHAARLLVAFIAMDASLLNSEQTSAAENRRPNVLFLISDDLNNFLGS